MPISKYFQGEGEKVMSSMKKTYKNPEKAKQVFYALANKQHQNPTDSSGRKIRPTKNGNA